MTIQHTDDHRTSPFRSERVAAGLLLLAAVLGLVVANVVIGPAVLEFMGAHVTIEAIAFDISVSHVVSDGLLAVFFFIVAVELRRELVIGELNSLSKAALPAIAAIGGVVVPALVYLLFTAGTDVVDGWPIPTATDIAFALGVLAIFGSALPTRVRVFLMALAVLDDLVAILIIAFFFTTGVEFASIGLAAIAITAFGAMSRLLRARSPWVLARRAHWPIIVTMIVLAVAAWFFTYQSGVHATIAGVALGFVISRRPGGRAVHAIEPWSNGVILPVFAFSAALVVIPSVAPSELSPAFWGILVALPVGKLIGITAGGILGGVIFRRRSGGMAIADLIPVAALGGIGFTVSLLMNELAFRGNREVADEGVLAVLLGSAIAIVIAAVLVSLRARHYKRVSPRASRQPQASPRPEPGRSPSATA
ncbi:sodium:proton antiporter [Leifsonia sp. Leaf325]|nr:Na+/H+ antiporter NhaA [Leifsonia sp. Leaf325]KQQ94434.1 sodium:proton antiporter [Leifsonia sp. Leaf325]